jgi:hypothetical protein
MQASHSFTLLKIKVFSWFLEEEKMKTLSSLAAFYLFSFV